jgi:thiazole/oxazole-forming peptide maturase SagC family component
MSEKFLRLLPTQILETDGALILRRGATALRIPGQSATIAAKRVLDALSVAGTQGVSENRLISLFAESDRERARELILRLISSRLIAACDYTNGDSPESETGETTENETDVFYWNLGKERRNLSDNLNSKRLLILGVNWISHQLALSLQRSGFERLEVVDHPLLRNLRFFEPDGLLRKGVWSVNSNPKAYDEWLSTTTLRPDTDFLIACSDFGGRERLRDWNRLCVRNGCYFLPVFLEEMICHIGPFVVPYRTACFECVREWRMLTGDYSQIRSDIDASAFEGQLANGFHPSMASIAGDLSAIEITKFCAQLSPYWRVGMMIELNLLTCELVKRKVMKMPRCTVCGALVRHPSTTFLRPERADNA